METANLLPGTACSIWFGAWCIMPAWVLCVLKECGKHMYEVIAFTNDDWKRKDWGSVMTGIVQENGRDPAPNLQGIPLIHWQIVGADKSTIPRPPIEHAERYAKVWLEQGSGAWRLLHGADCWLPFGVTEAAKERMDEISRELASKQTRLPKFVLREDSPLEDAVNLDVISGPVR